MTYATDPRVDAYIDALPDWQQDICREVRDLVHAADGEVTETIKRTRQPYFVLAGNICALLAHLVSDGELAIDLSDEIQAGIVVTHDGAVVHQATRALLAPVDPATGGGDA